MRLLRSIEIDKFRSFDSVTIDQLTPNVVLVGPNNSGKSNVLRALSLYFNEEIEPRSFLDVSRDYHIPSRQSKKKRQISISVEFELPTAFQMRKGLEDAVSLLGSHFWLRKTWSLESFDPALTLSKNGEQYQQLTLTEAVTARQFLNLITFRYVPNRVDHTSIIRQESPAIQRHLARRIANYSKQKMDPLFEDLRKFAKNMVDPIAEAMRSACTGISDLELATPAALFDMAFPSGFKVDIGDGGRVDDTLLGAGAQSLLMFHVLHMIDQYEFQNFGWRQAAVWAVEEPESSLHRELQVRLAALFRNYSERPDSRFQIISTTHSDIFVYGASSGFSITVEKGTSNIRPVPVHELADESSSMQVSTWAQPALKFPLDPVVLVEGSIDCAVLTRAAELLRAGQGFKFVTPSQLDPSLGDGKDNVERFVKSHARLLSLRLPRQPLMVLFDWDVNGATVSSVSAKYGQSNRVFRMDERACDPLVGSSFRGVERFYSKQLLSDASNAKIVPIATKKNGEMTIQPAELSSAKKALCEFFVANARAADCEALRPVFDQLESVAKGALI